MGPINTSIHSNSRNAGQGSSELDFSGNDFITFITAFSVTISKFVKTYSSGSLFASLSRETEVGNFEQMILIFSLKYEANESARVLLEVCEGKNNYFSL